MIHCKQDRKRRGGLFAATFVVGSLFAAGLAAESRAGRSQLPDERGVRISAKSIVGSPVINGLGYESASIEELLIDPETGRIDWVIVTLDPVASSTVAVPWSMLVMEADGTMRVSATAEDLVPLPEQRWDVSAARYRPPSEPSAPAADDGLVPREDFYPRYDTRSVQQFDGTVVGSVVAPIEGGTDVVMLVVDVGGDDIRVHVGPEWFVERHGIAIEAGDPISVVGSIVTIDAEPVLLVSELTLYGRRVAFRTQAGVPLW